MIEIAFNDTSRCVEKPGTAQFTRNMGAEVISTVFRGADLYQETIPSVRVEFSHYPTHRGYHRQHTVFWETEKVVYPPVTVETLWPNNFSDVIGDKTFGLLIADSTDLPVPKTTVINRHYAPFTFGRPTGSSESWLRTAPNKQTPGLYTTIKGWTDPNKLLEQEDPTHENIASILCQDAVKAVYSGAAVMGSDNRIIIEGKKGEGDSLSQ